MRITPELIEKELQSNEYETKFDVHNDALTCEISAKQNLDIIARLTIQNFDVPEIDVVVFKVVHCYFSSANRESFIRELKNIQGDLEAIMRHVDTIQIVEYSFLGKVLTCRVRVESNMFQSKTSLTRRPWFAAICTERVRA